jgi:hypothetical protein
MGKTRYSPHPHLDREQKMKAKMAEITGRTFDEWVGFAQAEGPGDKKALSKWLRAEHGHRSMDSNWIAQCALTGSMTDYGDPEPLVDALYSGSHEKLRKLHEKVVDAVLQLGDDVVVTACKTMVPAYRKHVFAEMKPTSGGVAVDLALGDTPFAGRLGKAAGRQPGERLSHRVVLGKAGDLDGTFRGWLAQAYEAGAGSIKRKADAAVPDDLAQALGGSEKAQATWETCTPAMQRDFIQWIASAKKAETRTKRVDRTIEKLAAGKKRIY